MPAYTGLNIRIEDNAGVPYGPGPITTMQGIASSELLDRAGRVAFTMPLTDPRAAIVQAKRIMRARGMLSGAVTDIATGIIDRLTVRANDENAALDVEGDNLLRELTYNLVDGLEVYEYATMAPDNVQEVVQAGGGSVSTDLPPWPNNIQLENGGGGNNTWLYIRHNRTFDQVNLTFTVISNTVTTMQVQYFDGTGWIDVAGLVDGTIVDFGGGDCTWGQSGTMAYTMPADWVEVEHDAEIGYWLRMRPTAVLVMTDVTISALTIRARNPTTNGPALVMAYAPAGWALAGAPGHATSLNAAYWLFEDNVTVLAALITLAELTGEHFRLGAGRTVVWLQEDETASGIRAVQHLSPNTAENPDAVLITAFERVQDSYEIVNRIYPTGAGFGPARMTLAACTAAAPAGYTLNTGLNYIETNGAVPRISRAIAFDEMQSIDTGATADTAAADQLFALALRWLQLHDSTPDTYRLTVTKLAERLYPGDTIRVIYKRILGAYTAIDVDADLLMLEVENRVSPDGVLSADLLVSTVDRYPETDIYTLMTQTQKGARVRRVAHQTTTTAIGGALVTLGVVTE